MAASSGRFSRDKSKNGTELAIVDMAMVPTSLSGNSGASRHTHAGSVESRPRACQGRVPGEPGDGARASRPHTQMPAGRRGGRSDAGGSKNVLYQPVVGNGKGSNPTGSPADRVIGSGEIRPIQLASARRSAPLVLLLREDPIDVGLRLDERVALAIRLHGGLIELEILVPAVRKQGHAILVAVVGSPDGHQAFE